jgi:cyanophycinase
MPTKIFLHGGGNRDESREATFGRFAAACIRQPADKLALVMAEGEETAVPKYIAAYSELFTAVGVPQEQIIPLVVTAKKPLTYEMVAQVAPSGLFLCGGVTPLYHQAVAANPGWLTYLQETHIPFGGTSAGAAIAAETAVLGGWKATRQAQSREILFVGAGEGLEQLTVRPGLGLMPFAVDVHASQMGTLTRLIHAVELGLVPEGWAIDENTMLVWNGRTSQIFGEGHCYHVQRSREGGVTVTIHVADLG